LLAVIVKQTFSYDIRCEVDLANSPVFHFRKYAHVKFSEIQEKISEQAALKEESRLKFLWNKRIDTDNSLEDVVERTEVAHSSQHYTQH
jgi:hypothetical protein